MLFRIVHPFEGVQDGKQHSFYTGTIVPIHGELAERALKSGWVEFVEKRETKIIVPEETKKKPILKLNRKE